jgi:hypothetical protein
MSAIKSKHHVYTRLQKENASRARHHYGNKAFIKKFREEAKLTYA